MNYWFHGCLKCNGTLYDGNDGIGNYIWTCINCGQEHCDVSQPFILGNPKFDPPKRSPNSINKSIDSSIRSYKLWWTKNKHIIHDLFIIDLSVSEVSKKWKQDPKVIRGIWDKFKDVQESMDFETKFEIMAELRTLKTLSEINS